MEKATLLSFTSYFIVQSSKKGSIYGVNVTSGTMKIIDKNMPIMAPMNWLPMMHKLVLIFDFEFNLPLFKKKAKVIAGLKWPPETGPKVT